MKYETCHYFCSHPDTNRATTPPARVALGGCFHPAPLPDRVGQRQRSNAGCHRPHPRLHPRDRPQHHPRLRGRRTDRPEGEVLASPQRPPHARCGFRRALAAPVAPEPPSLRPTPQHLDVELGGPGLLRPGLDAPRVEPGHHPPGHPASGRFLAAGQALDHQPRPRLRAKKKARDRLIRLAATHPEWVLGFQDECWWSRLAQPNLHAWTADAPLRLQELAVGKEDTDPKALACYGLLRGDTGGLLLRFVEGRPVSQVTGDFLEWVCGELAREGKKALLLVWDNASWHISARVRGWIKGHNRRAKREGGVRIVVCPLPSKSPWLNPIEPKWLHGKRAIVEPERMLSAAEVEKRACDYYGCAQHEHLQQTDPPRKLPVTRKKVA